MTVNHLSAFQNLLSLKGDENKMQIENSRTFGKKLQEKRKKLGLTQEQLAKILDTTRNTVARWERDEVVPESKNMVWLSIIALETAAEQNKTEIRANLLQEIDIILDRLEQNGAVINTEIERMKANMNLA